MATQPPIRTFLKHLRAINRGQTPMIPKKGHIVIVPTRKKAKRDR